MTYYKLSEDGKTLVETDLIKWAESFGKKDRRIAHNVIGDTCISTVFLGLDHSFNGGPPLLFETMIFGGPSDMYQTRCSTYDEALAMHEAALKIVNE